MDEPHMGPPSMDEPHMGPPKMDDRCAFACRCVPRIWLRIRTFHATARPACGEHALSVILTWGHTARKTAPKRKTACKIAPGRTLHGRSPAPPPVPSCGAPGRPHRAATPARCGAQGVGVWSVLGWGGGGREGHQHAAEFKVWGCIQRGGGRTEVWGRKDR
eukprot:215600-Chlamydomonas_euryale.AAC.1